MSVSINLLCQPSPFMFGGTAAQSQEFILTDNEGNAITMSGTDTAIKIDQGLALPPQP